MDKRNMKVIIIGAGLTGLTLAYRLKQSNISFKIIEARNRIGGRINTLYNEGRAPLEMGATWLGQQHKHLLQLLKELNLAIFDQKLGRTAIYEPISTSPHQLVHLPPSQQPSYRIINGTHTILSSIAQQIEPKDVILNQTVQKISKLNNKASVITDKGEFYGDKVVSTLPPHLLSKTIEITPTLPHQVTDVMRSTHTWMGESIKVALTYKEKFWDGNDISGTIFSNVGPIPEMYDHSDYAENHFALKGFLNGNYYGISKKERLNIILQQLQKYYGSIVQAYQSYHEQVWRNEKYTHIDYDQYIVPHQHNGHTLYQKAYWNGQLYIGGTETSRQHGGYMDGAVHSANMIAENIITQLNSTTKP